MSDFFNGFSALEMFHLRSQDQEMQTAFDFGEALEIARMRDRLRSAFGYIEFRLTRSPMGQLVKSIISSLTYDAVSAAAYERLVETFPDWAGLAKADLKEIEAAICNVTNAATKAAYLKETSQAIARSHPDFCLDFLRGWPIDQALRWLEQLSGVGRKVSASTLNFSTLHRPAFVIDTHILRVFKRFGLIDAHAEIKEAYEAIMPALETWSATELAELHVLVKRLGQVTCRRHIPLCRNCPINERCQKVVEPVHPAPVRTSGASANHRIIRSRAPSTRPTTATSANPDRG